MDITFSVSGSGVFRRIALTVAEEPEQLELSAIVTSPSGREEIFLPSPEKIRTNATYPSSGGRFITQTAKGKYQIIFQPKEAGLHELKLVGRISGKPFQKILHINF
jgi:hypothetical protein